MLTAFLTIAGSMFVAELGDKTQLLVVGFASKYKLRDIFFGVSAAVILLNALGVFLGALLSEFIPIDYIGLLAGFFFFVFALLSLKKERESEECRTIGSNRSYGAILCVGMSFFVAELGDKTQLSAIAFAAKNPGALIAVFLGAVTGMLLADGAAILAGLVLNKKLPENVFKLAAFIIFTVFGFSTLRRSLYGLFPESALTLLIVISVLYLAALAYIVLKTETAPSNKE